MKNNEVLNYKNESLKWVTAAVLAVAALWHIIDYIGDFADYTDIAVGYLYLISSAIFIIATIVLAVASTKLAVGAEKTIVAVGFLMLAVVPLLDFIRVIIWLSEIVDELSRWHSYYSVFDLLADSPLNIIFLITRIIIMGAFVAAAALLLTNKNKTGFLLSAVGVAFMLVYQVAWLAHYLINGEVAYIDWLVLARNVFEDIAILVFCVFGIMGANATARPAFNPNMGYNPNMGFNPNPTPNPMGAVNESVGVVFCRSCGAKYDTGKGEFCPVCGLSFRQKL